MSEENITLYKQRDFGQKINATIEYIRYNFGPIMKMVLIIAIPMGIVSSLAFSKYFSSMTVLVGNPNMSDAEAMGFLGGLGVTYLLMISIYMVTYSLMVAAIYNYMKARAESAEIDYLEILKASFKHVPALIGLSIIVGFISIIGMFFFVLPGIYLGVVFSLSAPIYLFEQEGIGNALSKAFKLISGKWWSTLGLLFVTYMIAGAAGYIFAIPTYVLMFGDLISNIDQAENDPTAIFEAFSSWSATIGMAISVIGSYLTYTIPIIAISFQYFNLSERMEGKGLKGEIADFENLS